MRGPTQRRAHVPQLPEEDAPAAGPVAHKASQSPRSQPAAPGGDEAPAPRTRGGRTTAASAPREAPTAPSVADAAPAPVEQPAPPERSPAREPARAAAEPTLVGPAEVAPPQETIPRETAVAPAAVAHPEPLPLATAEEPAPALATPSSYAPTEPSLEIASAAADDPEPAPTPSRWSEPDEESSVIASSSANAILGPATLVASGEPIHTQVTVRNVAAFSRALELQRAVQNIPEVRKVQALQFERGVLILAVEHAGATDLADAIAHLPLGAELISHADGRLELTVGTR
jgi:hypothetical protein